MFIELHDIKKKLHLVNTDNIVDIRTGNDTYLYIELVNSKVVTLKESKYFSIVNQLSTTIEILKI